MSVLDAQYRTMTCDGPECKNTVTFEQRQDNVGVADAVEKHPWMKTHRMVQAQGRVFLYCSDECEIKAVGDSKHNPEERKKIVLPEGASAIAQAATQAAAAEEATKALKDGRGVTLQGS